MCQSSSYLPWKPRSRTRNLTQHHIKMASLSSATGLAAASTPTTAPKPFYFLFCRIPRTRITSTAARLQGGRGVCVKAAAAKGVERRMGAVEDKLGIAVERNPAETKLSDLGVKLWPK